VSIERGDDGPVRIRRGRHAGTLGYYDDDLDGEERAAKAIVYLGEPFESDYILVSPVRLTGDQRRRASRARGGGVGKGGAPCSGSAMVLPFASIPEGLGEPLECSIFTHSRGRSRTVATARECMAFKRSRVRLPSAPLHHSLGLTET